MKNYEPVPTDTLAAIVRAASAMGPIESWTWFENSNSGGGEPSFVGGVEEVEPRVFGDGTTHHVTLVTELGPTTVEVERGRIGEKFANYVATLPPSVAYVLAQEVLELRAEVAELLAERAAADRDRVVDPMKKSRPAR